MLSQTLLFKNVCLQGKTSSTTTTYYLVDSWKGQCIDPEYLLLAVQKYTFKTLLGNLF